MPELTKPAATTTPGRNAQLAAERVRYIPRGLATTMKTFSRSARGTTVTDVEGREFLDFAGGISVMNVGHGHPRVLAALHQQLDRLVHPAAQVMMPEGYVELAGRLCRLAPVQGEVKALLLNSGAEAVENAIKLARAFTGRDAIVSFNGSFHGRTLLAMTLTGKAYPYRQGFGPGAPEVYHVTYPDPYRSTAGPEGCVDESLRALEQLFKSTIPARQVAAVIVEPVQGEGGFIVPPDDFLSRLQAVCEEHGILLIADEVQTGFARTGTMFAVEHSGVRPDILVLAKSMGAGLPISAVVGRAEVMDAADPGGLGGTYAGNALACAAALAAIDVIEEEGLAHRAGEIGYQCLRRMREWQAAHEVIGNVRGLGAMVGMELITDRGTRAPDAARTGELLALCHADGLILLRAGLYDNVVRLMMPLTITDAELTRGLDIIEAALARLAGTAAT